VEEGAGASTTMDGSRSARGANGNSRNLCSLPRGEGARKGAKNLFGDPTSMVATVSPGGSRLDREGADGTSDEGSDSGPVGFKELFLGAGVRALNRSYFLGALALWHSYGLWLAACTDAAVGLVLLVRWYVGWLSFAIQNCKAGDVAGFSCICHFFATFMRSYWLIALVSEVARFCFWLIRDAWRMDVFEAYRRTLCGEARAEMELGALYAVGWPRRFLFGSRRGLDAAVQLIIYTTLDVIPPFCGIMAYSAPGGTPAAAAEALFQALALASCAHVAVFFAAWVATDVWIKVAGFQKALRGETKFALDAEEILRDAIQEEVEEAQESCSEQEALLAVSALELHAGEALRAAARSGAAFRMPKRTTADWLNLCVPVRAFFHMAAPLVAGPAIVAAGAALGRPCLVAGGAALIPLLVTYSYAKLRHSHRAAKGFPRCLDSDSRALWALQAWGETCCGLEYQEQMKRRVSLARIVLLQALMFAFFGWWTYMVVCIVMLLLVIIRQACFYSEQPWGWLIGMAEGLLAALCLVVLSLTFPTTARWRSVGPSLGLLLVAAARQLGLARENPDCYRLAHAVSFALGLFTLLVIGVVLFSEMTYDTASFDLRGTSFCNASLPTCSYFSVPYLRPNETHKLTCPAWFSVGERGRKFSLIDFGLFAAVAYESEQLMPRALAHYFPGWRVVYSHWESQSMRESSGGGWTTFFEYASPDNATSVFAIRGTHTAIDALNDIILWTPAVVFQGFGFVGPNVLPPVEVALAAIISFFEGNYEYSAFFASLLTYVERRLKEDPGREFFITGHSLGGGLAKLVAARAGLRAVTFMAPGLSATGHVVYRNAPQDELHGDEMLTVQPSYDIVSRIDTQTGLVVPVGCSKTDGLYCHLIGPALCEIFRHCGSGREGQDLVVPCGTCAEMPCPAAGQGRYVAAWPTVHPGAAAAAREAEAVADATAGSPAPAWPWPTAVPRAGALTGEVVAKARTVSPSSTTVLPGEGTAS